MRDGHPSQTAAYVAACRAVGQCLPPEVRLCSDPYGWHFCTPGLAWLRPIAERFPSATGRLLVATPLRRLLLWIQLRTRMIDDVATRFVAQGGRQIVLLGAGFDCRAVRLAPELGDARVFEVDHPSTLQRKRSVLDSSGIGSRARYLAWDFERDPLEELPRRLQEQGLAPTAPTLTIWEGVIPYLTEQAVEATLSAIRSFGSAGSQVVMHYIERRRIESRTIFHLFAHRVGEPLRFGWEPSALPGWLASRGFELLVDRGDEDLADELFAGRWTDSVRGFRGAGGRIAVARQR